MGFVSKFKDFVGIPDEGYYEDQDMGMEQEEERSYSNGDEDRKKQVVNVTAPKLQVVLVKPERFDNATEIADHLNAKRTVVLNLESTEKDVSRRLVDFLCGVAYANGGKIQRVANSTFIITPYNVDMMGEILDELENTGVFFQ
ncbi:MAG: cell division protein SepF [Eubacteriales bacterium]|jgi:cell division inhibitor SepF